LGCARCVNHNWDPYWSTSLFGKLLRVRNDGGANDNILGLGTTTAREPIVPPSLPAIRVKAVVEIRRRIYLQSGLNVSQLGVVNPLDSRQEPDVLRPKSQWFHLDQKMSGSSVFAATAPKPTALYESRTKIRFAAASRPAYF